MRRMTRFVTWGLIAALLLTPALLSRDARAQNISPNLTGVMGPAGMLWYSAASQIVSNTTAAAYLFSGTIPASAFSTQGTTNMPSANLGPANASVPLHLILEGLLDRLASPGALSVGVNFGVGTSTRPTSSNPFIATVTFNNVIVGPGALVAVPIRIDVWLNPIATGTATNATPNIVNTVYMRARMEFTNVSAVGASSIVLNQGTIAQVNTASAHILNVIWDEDTAGQTLRLYKVILKQVD